MATGAAPSRQCARRSPRALRTARRLPGAKSSSATCSSRPATSVPPTRRTARPGDARAGVEYRAGELEGARAHSQEALRLGTQHPLILYHAGVIAQESGDLVTARQLLRQASALNPRFSLLWADDLAARLDALESGE